MNPAESPGSLKDYAPVENPGGCKDRQLAIKTTLNAQGGNDVVVTGFHQGGESAVWRKAEIERPWVGSVVASSFQPTGFIPIGTPCSKRYLGTMARQPETDDVRDVNNLFISQVQCMISPLCPAEADGVCFMPVNSVTIRINPNTSSYICPVGMFVSDLEVNEAPKGEDCFGQCLLIPFRCWVDNHRFGEPQWSFPLASQNPKLYQGVIITETSWHWACPDISITCNSCKTGWDIKGRTQATIASIVCTNDITKTAIEVQVD